MLRPSPDAVPRIPLNDGNSIPQLGLGVYKVDDDEAERTSPPPSSPATATSTPRRLPQRERRRRALGASGIARDDVFVTTKVWNDQQGYDSTLRSFDHSLAKLGLDVVDLYLIHWPAPRAGPLRRDVPGAREDPGRGGPGPSIGVSNFQIHHLERLLGETDVVPAINQVEVQPWLQQRELRAFGEARHIVTEAWSPLARGTDPGQPRPRRIAAPTASPPRRSCSAGTCSRGSS